MQQFSFACCLLSVLSLVFGPASSSSLAVGSDAELAPIVEHGVAFLAAAQAEDGSYSSFAGTGITSLVTASLLRNGRTPNDPLVARSLEYLQSQVKKDGGIYKAKSRYRNYETCLAIFCFVEANAAEKKAGRPGKYDALLDRAEAFIKDIQWDGGEGHDESSTSFGGAGYGKHNRPDLSNTNMFVEALKATGNGPDDPHMKAALAFVSRCQNKETEHNDTKFAAKVGDGGFYYTAAAGGSSQAGETANGGLRSYGSMTYAGLKSMIYAGVNSDDPRVKAAFEWAQKHYTVTENPGMADNGLFYYYHTFAKALDAIGQDEIVDTKGKKHNWRQELISELAKRQNDDGSWINKNERWLESDPNLVTGYVLMTLSYCR